MPTLIISSTLKESGNHKRLSAEIKPEKSKKPPKGGFLCRSN
jgi:hypothetical protein